MIFSYRFNIPILDKAENDSKTFGLPLDDPPISQEENDLFSTQDLETVCSGVFKGKHNYL